MQSVHAATRERVAFPKGIDSARAKLVYLYLGVHEGAAIEEISTDVQMPIMTLAPILRFLERDGYVERKDDRYFRRVP